MTDTHLVITMPPMLHTPCLECGELIAYFEGKRKPKYHKGRCEMIAAGKTGDKAKTKYKRRLEKRKG